MQLKNLLFPACTLLTISVSAQSVIPADNDAAYTRVINGSVEHAPKAGYDLGQYLSANIHYPKNARRHNIEGRVIIKFIVNENGSISDCIVEKGIGGGCDEEALRVVESMPPWKPAFQNDKYVKVYFTLPVMFKLQD